MLLERGMDVARINLNYLKTDEYRKVIKNIK